MVPAGDQKVVPGELTSQLTLIDTACNRMARVSMGDRMIRIFAFGVAMSLWSAVAGAQARSNEIRDARNRNIPHTDTHFTMSRYESLSVWEARRAQLKQQILSAAGLLPMPEKTPLHAQVFGRIERKEHGFSIEKVLLETMPGYYVGGNLYRPLASGKQYPAVLLAHGHHQYGRIEHQHRLHWTVRGEEGQRRENRYPDQVAWAAPLFSPPTMAMNLAMQGYVVMSWDMVGYNDTIQTPHTFGGDREKLWSFGPLGLQLWNATRVLDFVQSLEDVDATQIAMTGASGGGSQTFLLAALDERIKVSAPVVMVGGIMQGGSACENAPGLRLETYNTELAALMAPRPMLLVGSPVDQSRHTLTEDYPAVRSVYALYGKEKNVEATIIDAPHNYNRFSREAVYRFFAKHFNPVNAKGDISERPIRLGAPNTLLVLHNRTLPANAVSYDELFAQWVRLAEEQSNATVDENVSRERLRAACAARWPESVSASSSDAELVLSRNGLGDHVPARWLPGASGTGVVLVVHEQGSAKAEHTETVRRLRSAGKSVLLIDTFQTGGAVEPRNFQFRKNRPEKGYYLTFNRSEDANRIQDILTALAFLKQQGEQGIQLVGLGKAAIWSLFAAAIAPVDLSLCADLGGFEGRDQEFIDAMFVPGIQRAGGVNAALRLTESARRRGCEVISQ